MTVSAKPLFQATKPKPKADPAQVTAATDWPDQPKPGPREVRDPLDFDPTPPDATAAFLSVEGDRMREIGGPVWENAVGAGHIARVLQSHGFEVIGSDVVDRGWPGTFVSNFYEFHTAAAPIVVTNPPYGEINARDGHGRWLRHLMGLQPDYVAMLLSADWAFARTNGMDALHAEFPVSREYKCCWKIDFRGGGSPPQRNVWLVWDADHRGETITRRLFRDGSHPAQGEMFT